MDTRPPKQWQRRTDILRIRTIFRHRQIILVREKEDECCIFLILVFGQCGFFSLSHEGRRLSALRGLSALSASKDSWCDV